VYAKLRDGVKMTNSQQQVKKNVYEKVVNFIENWHELIKLV